MTDKKEDIYYKAEGPENFHLEENGRTLSLSSSTFNVFDLINMGAEFLKMNPIKQKKNKPDYT